MNYGFVFQNLFQIYLEMSPHVSVWKDNEIIAVIIAYFTDWQIVIIVSLLLNVHNLP